MKKPIYQCVKQPKRFAARLYHDPYVMIYDKPHAPQELRHLQRWVNNIRIFRKTKWFEEYMHENSQRTNSLAQAD